jgi:hypothetical protein
MNELSLGKIYLKELEAEITASRKCPRKNSRRIIWLETAWKKSMELGYLVLLVAEMPRWIATMINDDAIDFATFKHIPAKTTDDLLAQFDGNIKSAKEALQNVTNEQLDEPFSLKANGQVLFSSPKKGNVSSTINHWVHHRGQLTVYMRLNDIPVPSIYGPSADDKSFG